MDLILFRFLLRKCLKSILTCSNHLLSGSAGPALSISIIVICILPFLRCPTSSETDGSDKLIYSRVVINQLLKKLYYAILILFYKIIPYVRITLVTQYVVLLLIAKNTLLRISNSATYVHNNKSLPSISCYFQMEREVALLQNLESRILARSFLTFFILEFDHKQSTSPGTSILEVRYVPYLILNSITCIITYILRFNLFHQFNPHYSLISFF